MNRRTFLSLASYAATAAPTMVGQQSQVGVSPRAIVPLRPPDHDLIRVACAISKGTTEIDFVGPQAVFQTWHVDPASKKPVPRFKIFTVAESAESAESRIPDYSFANAPTPHVVVVPAQSGSPALLEWLRHVHAQADVTMSVCVGARHLAAAGLLNGQRATTHHESIGAFEREYPHVVWVRHVRFVENEKISTSGGLTAGIDLALHVVERYFGQEAALGVAEHLEYDGKRWMTS